ncbi:MULTISPECIES: hypothetical protein [unclassified Arthrobacter]|uniref:hypothetical protein n=1 Tax=Micrococcaceae TaxID=1268 RepID=UPI00036BB5E4|nr:MULTISPECIES: hypothetical protein [unclassified Arthrobacter]
MHPLAAIGLVFLAGLAWLGTVLTLLVALAKARRRLPADVGQAAQSVETQGSAGSGAIT